MSGPHPAPSPAPRLVPLGWHWGGQARRLVAAGRARAMLGGGFAASAFEWWRLDDERLERQPADPLEIGERAPEELAAFAAPRPRPFHEPRIMAILNVTPDSFSDGGRHLDAEAAIRHGLRMIAEGADIVDVGGESTRPGAAPVDAGEELRRVIPVIRALAAEGATVSVDSRKAEVMEAAIEAGGRMLNDVSGFSFDPRAPHVAAACDVPVIVTHSRGTPRTMNRLAGYRQPLLEVCGELEARLRLLWEHGVARHRMVVDPGIGFAKKQPHNLELLRYLPALHGLGLPLALGLSRKGITRALEEIRPPEARLPASLAAAFHALTCGVVLLRVHDVAATRQMVDLFRELAA